MLTLILMYVTKLISSDCLEDLQFGSDPANIVSLIAVVL